MNTIERNGNDTVKRPDEERRFSRVEEREMPHEEKENIVPAKGTPVPEPEEVKH